MKRFLLFASIFLSAMLFTGETFVSAQTENARPKKSTKAVSAKPVQMPMAANSNAGYFSQIEREILDEINLARTNPTLYITYLEDFRKYYEGKNLSLPSRQMIVTNEGIAALDDAIKTLKSSKTVAALESSEFIAKATKDHLQDMIKNSIFGHKGSDGSFTDQRLNRYIYAETIRFGENVVMSGLTAREVVIAMLIDDGYPSRGHRKNVLDGGFKFVGLSNGVGQNKFGLSVVIFATDAKERNSNKQVAGKQIKEIL